MIALHDIIRHPAGDISVSAEGPKKVAHCVSRRVALLWVVVGFCLTSGQPSLAQSPKNPSAIAAQAAPTRNEILWDQYGVPHIYATSEAGAFYGFGWAQTQSHGDMILKLYGEARGKGAEYWGPTFEETTTWLLTNGVPARAQVWYDQQTPQFRANLDAFAKGINDYAAANPARIAADSKVVLPVTGVDVVAHAHRLMNFIYVAAPGRTIGEGEPEVLAEDGSNTWAVAPAKSASGNTMLLQNPHLPWANGYFVYFEAHMVAPSFEIYGATQIGLPVVRFAFNQQMGISNTVNNMLGATNYKLTPRDGGYVFDNAVRAFDEVRTTYNVRQTDGTLATKDLTIRSSVHGPVFTRKNGDLVAVRVAGLDRPGMLHQYFDMVTAPNYEAFHRSMQRLQVPTFNISYADRDGRIEYIHNGMAPKRSTGDIAFWSGLVPGDSSQYLWNDIHPFEDLPRVTDPSAGFIQNANDPPWFPTWPTPIKASDYPAYMATHDPLSMRAQNSLKMMAENRKVSFAQFRTLKTNVHALLADRVLPALLTAASTETDPEMKAAVRILRAWDRKFEAKSRGALLFEEWAKLFAGPTFNRQGNYETPWSADAAISTPNGIKDPAAAVTLLRQAIIETKRKYGTLNRPFGDVSRFKLGNVDLPGRGGFGNLGSFSVITWSDANELGIRTPNHGETWTAMIEFSTPIKAYGLMSYGNARQSPTTHHSDQLKHLSEKRFRRLLLNRRDIEANSAVRTELKP